jgi:hypothetical protein
MVAALPRLCSPAMLPRLTGHRDLTALLDWARGSAWPLPPDGRAVLANGLRSTFPTLAAQAVAQAKRAVEHQFDLLGSGPQSLGPEIDWLSDFKSGATWPPAFYRSIDYRNLDRPSDVKVPWEVSRCHHLVDLARAHLLAPSDEYVDEIGAQLRSWIAANPVGRTINWACTMEVAIRAVNWAWVLGVAAPELDDETLTLTLSSLVQHGFFTARNLEVSEVAGNHYVSDALGLVAIGAYLRSGWLGQRWLRQGGAILAAELQKQVYPDGVDHEMSIPYHRLVTEIFLMGGLILRVVGHDPGSGYWDRVECMAEFTAAYTRPDGTAPVWGDADDGRVVPFSGRHLVDHRHLLSTAAVVFQRADLAAAAGPLVEDTLWLLGVHAADAFRILRPTSDRRRCVAFPDGGFAVLRDKSWHVLFDAGPVGLRGRGGHGHNDALAVEIWCDGPLVVDPGSYVYTADVEARYAFRSTRAHNTPMLDDHEINDVLGLWLLTDQSQAQTDEAVETEFGGRVMGHHSGYRKVDPRAVVRREVDVSDRTCVVRDRVAGACGRWTVRWTFAPSVTVAYATVSGARARRGVDEFRLDLAGAAAVSVGTTWVSPSYGVRHAAVFLDVEFAGDECEMVIHAT